MDWGSGPISVYQHREVLFLKEMEIEDAIPDEDRFLQVGSIVLSSTQPTTLQQRLAPNCPQSKMLPRIPPHIMRSPPNPIGLWMNHRAR